MPVPQLTRVRAVRTTCMPSYFCGSLAMYTAIALQGHSCGLGATQWVAAAFHKNSLCMRSGALDPSSASKGAGDVRL